MTFPVLYTVLCCVIAYAAVAATKAPKLGHIPTVKPLGLLSSYIEAVRLLTQISASVHEGCIKYGGRPFKIPLFTRWMVAVGDPKLVEELRKATDEQLSLVEAVGEMLQLRYTVGKEIMTDTFHVHTVRSSLTRNISSSIGVIFDEVENSFSEYIPTRDKEWVEVPAYNTIMHMVCRISNRVFVGLPICRNPDYQELNENFTLELSKAGFFLSMFPQFLKPILAPFIANPERNMRRIIKHVGPEIEARISWLNNKSAAWDNRPNDLISWLLESAPESRRTVREIALRILFLNFGAIHTTTISVTHVLYTLAVRPEYIQPLREESEAVIGKEGWSKASMGKLVKLDSFLKETLRQKAGPLASERKVLKDFTLSDGTFLPAGTYVAIATAPAHYNEEIYPDPHSFDGFRFSRMHEAEQGTHSTKDGTANLAPSWLAFGTGRHACPGRFFAVNEIKCMMAYILLNYDFKLGATERERPVDMEIGGNALPNQSAKLAFKKRTSPV